MAKRPGQTFDLQKEPGTLTRQVDPENLQDLEYIKGLDLTECDDDGRCPKRTGNWRTGCAHIITAVIGSGALSLGWAMSCIGWAFGPIILLLFALVTLYTAQLLAEAYRFGDEYTGKRSKNYMAAVKARMGIFDQLLCAVVQYLNLFGTGVGYTVTGSLSLIAAKRAVCFHKHDYDTADAPCSFDNNPWMIMFGAIQLVASQIPDIGGLWWLSYLSAAMSFLYCLIGLGLAIGKATQKGHADYGTAWGTSPANTEAQATWNVTVAFGSFAFAYSYSLILIEIQDSMAQPPSEAKSMKKATSVGVLITTIFYMSLATIGYAGFGNDSPSNLLTGFGFFKPYWLVAIANVGVFIHLLGAYQVFMQPFMQWIEDLFLGWFPNSRIIQWQRWYKIPVFGYVCLSPLRLVNRTILVICTTVLAMLLPFFNDLVGILGALAFHPLTVYFPIEMHIIDKQIPRWSRKWILLQSLSFVCLLVTIAAMIGSVAYLVIDLEAYEPFHSISSSVTNPRD